MECSLIHLIFVIIFAPIVHGFSVSKVNVKLLQPKGIQFSLQEKSDDVYSDVKIFIFASKGLINNSKVVESSLNRDDNGLWIYETTNVDLRYDDTIEYWLYVEHSKLGYYSNAVLKVSDIPVLQPEERASIRTTTSTSVSGTYPHVNVKLLKPNGIRFSIDDEANALNNVKLIIFASKPITNNSKLIEVPLTKNIDNEIWNYELANVLLKVDDIIEYWLCAEKYGLGYFSNEAIKLQDIQPDDESSFHHKSLPMTLMNETFPVVDAKMNGTNKLIFSVQDQYDDAFNDVKILIFSPSSLINKDLKYIEYPLSRDDGGLWIYEMQNVTLKYDEIIEYWIYAEKPNVAHFASQILKVQDIAPPPSTTPTTTPLDLKTTTTTTPTTTTEAYLATTTSSSKACEASVSTVNGKSVGCKNSIIFNEDFNSDNLKYWSFDTRFPLDDSTADAEFTLYEKRSETSYIRDNMLSLKAESLKRVTGFDDTRIRIGSYNLNERCTPVSDDDRECERQAQFGYILPPVTSAYLTTRNKFSFAYGRIEARIRAPIGDYLYAQITLQPSQQNTNSEKEASNSSSQHLKVFFIRGNERLRDVDEEVGGNRVYGGAILSKNPKNNLKWLKSKHFPNSHLGNDFHIYELLWTPLEISLSIDGIKYGSLSSNLRESAMVAKIKSAVNWANNGPFDKEHFMSINLAAGSVKNFYSFNSTLLNGMALEPKPWNDTDPRAERSFYLAHDKWYPTWKKPSLDVDYIKVYAV